MGALVQIKGQVLGKRDLNKTDKKTGVVEKFATQISVLTEVDGEIGDTILKVNAWTGDFDKYLEGIDLRQEVVWAVAVDAGRFGLEATLRKVLVDTATPAKVKPAA